MPWSEAVSNKQPPLQSKLQAPSIYFEVRLLESLVTTPGAGVFLGFSTSSNCTSPPICPLGSDSLDTFGIVFEQNTSNNQTCLIHAGVKRAYGKVSVTLSSTCLLSVVYLVNFLSGSSSWRCGWLCPQPSKWFGLLVNQWGVSGAYCANMCGAAPCREWKCINGS